MGRRAFLVGLSGLVAMRARAQSPVLEVGFLHPGSAVALAPRLAAVIAITLFPEYADAGGLMAYGTSLPDLFHQAGEMVGKVLAGTNPADLPVERPSRFELVLKLKTAAALGIAIPPMVQLRADRVVE